MSLLHDHFGDDVTRSLAQKVTFFIFLLHSKDIVQKQENNPKRPPEAKTAKMINRRNQLVSTSEGEKMEVGITSDLLQTASFIKPVKATSFAVATIHHHQ